MDGNGDFLGMVMGDGKQTTPSLKFGFEPNTGIYRETTEPTSFTIVKRGVKRVRCTDTETEITGPVVIDDIKVDSITAEDIQVDGQLTIRDGTQEDPSINFLAAPHTGIYRDGTGIGFTQGSVKKMEIDSSLITGTVPIQGQYFRSSNAGTVTTPGYNFETVAPGYGMYYNANTLKFATGGNERLSLGNSSALTSSLSINGTASTGDLTVAGSLAASGTATVGALSTSGTVASGALTVTGSLAASGTATVGALSTSGTVASGALTVTGSLAASGTATVGALSTSGTLASGATSVTGTITATDDVKYPHYTIYATRAATQTINNASVTDVLFTSAPVNSNFSFSNPTSQFTIPKNGYYAIRGTIEYDVNITSWRSLAIRSGTTNLCQETQMAVADLVNPCPTRMTIAWDAQLTTSDGIRLTLYQTSGASINLLGGATIKIDRLHD